MNGPLSRVQIGAALKHSYAVELCHSTTSAWATVELVIEQGVVKRTHVIASSPTSPKFHRCVERYLTRLHFPVQAKRTVARATLRVTRALAPGGRRAKPTHP